jgi:hypothetical protein
MDTSCPVCSLRLVFGRFPPLFCSVERSTSSLSVTTTTSSSSLFLETDHLEYILVRTFGDARGRARLSGRTAGSSIPPRLTLPVSSSRTYRDATSTWAGAAVFNRRVFDPRRHRHISIQVIRGRGHSERTGRARCWLNPLMVSSDLLSSSSPSLLLLRHLAAPPDLFLTRVIALGSDDGRVSVVSGCCQGFVPERRRSGTASSQLRRRSGFPWMSRPQRLPILAPSRTASEPIL